jgi:preprotein translocase subunit SecD
MSQHPARRDDWATHATDNLERVVTTVRDRTTRPLLLGGRALVFGLLAGTIGVVAVVLLMIIAIRVLTVLTDRVWLSYVILGALCCVAGLVCLAKRQPSKRPEPA